MKLKTVIDRILFPKRCSCCDEVISINKDICESCKEKLHRLNNICNICGIQKDKCECNRRVFLFNGITAPFENNGSAQEGVYGMKFCGMPYASGFYGKNMYDSIKRDFKDVKFDIITAVPMSKRTKRKRGYNQAELLAKAIAKEMNVPYCFKMLLKCRDNSTQHNLTLKERVKNVAGAYKADSAVCGKTVLLVDDIKTTGATLNECSKQLLLCGASSVYCVVALMTEKSSQVKK